MAAIPVSLSATYYVNTTGDDLRSGTSPDEAWRTIERVNRVALKPGDRVLLEGGQRFSGPLKFDALDGGDPDQPVTVSTHRLDELGPATIDAGQRRGIDVYNMSGLQIAGLRVVGAGAKINTKSGILLLSTKNRGSGGVVIDDVEVTGFGKHGISIGAWNTTSGYRDVRIVNCTTHHNYRTGVFTWGPWGAEIYAHRQIYIGSTVAFKMKGGSGLTLSSVDGGIIEHCVAHNNGEEYSGGAGIWAWDSNDILFQFNESYENRTNGVDGDGFDFDGGVTNSVMQYNYSHDNDAAGFLLAQYRHAPQAMDNIVIRFNISENDSRKKSYGAIHVWNGDKRDRMKNIHIYNNTVYLSPQPAKGRNSLAGHKPLGMRPYPDVASAIAFVTPVESATVFNNLFVTTGGERLVTTSIGHGDLMFQNNAYWAGESDADVDWMGTIHSSVQEWLASAADQERIGTEIVAVFADPLLVAPGSAGVVGTADFLSGLSGYRLRRGSPLLGRGIDLRTALAVDSDTRGFFGNLLSEAMPPAIGANIAEN
jgi:hypothetical protein